MLQQRQSLPTRAARELNSQPLLTRGGLCVLAGYRADWHVAIPSFDGNYQLDQSLRRACP